VLTAKRLRYARDPVMEIQRAPGRIAKIALAAAWFELALSLLWIVILLTFR
jgi:hypothetical protein